MRCALAGFLIVFAALSGSDKAIAQAATDEHEAALSGGFDLIELRSGKGDELFLWDGSFAWGNSTDQAVLMAEGGGAVGTRIDDVQARLLYSRSIANNVVLLAGARHDFQPHPHDSYAVAGIQGIVGSRLSWEAFAFLSDDGQLTGDAQLIYQLPISAKLYLEPRAGIAWSAQRTESDGVGAGFTDAEASLRLRLKLSAKVNAYVGVAHERLLADSREIGRAQGDRLQSTMAVVGFGFSL
ncbi:copper resistance protein B [Sphingobium mellinum]|uniref:copper resistance protein B n=1 Tax=Sphingobium mellinum TaxID=1387166 RepID=UPI0030EBDC8F